MSAEAATINLTAATIQESQKKSTNITEMLLKRAVQGHTSHLNTVVHSSFKEIRVKIKMAINVPLCNSDAVVIFSNNQERLASFPEKMGEI